MTSVFLALFEKIFADNEKTLAIADFERWLLQGDGAKKNSMIFQLLKVARGEKERLEAQALRASDRLKRRKDEKSSTFSENSSAFVNSIDNRVEEITSLLNSFSALSNNGTTTSLSAEWFLYLQEQFLALSMVENAIKSGKTQISQEEDKELFDLLKIEDNEKTRLGCGEKMAGDIALVSLRGMLLYRIQICLLSRAADGTFVNLIPFRTDQSAMITDVATGRFILLQCMKKLQTLHDTTQNTSYEQLLQKCRDSHALEFDANDFPMQYNKKNSIPFETQTCALIAEFRNYFSKLTDQERQDFKNSGVEQQTGTRKRLRKSKSNNGDTHEIVLSSSQNFSAEIASSSEKTNLLAKNLKNSNIVVHSDTVERGTPVFALPASHSELERDYGIAPHTPTSNNQFSFLQSLNDLSTTTAAKNNNLFSPYNALSNSHFHENNNNCLQNDNDDCFQNDNGFFYTHDETVSRFLDAANDSTVISQNLQTFSSTHVTTTSFASNVGDTTDFMQESTHYSAARLQELIDAKKTILNLNSELNRFRLTNDAEKEQLRLHFSQELSVAGEKIALLQNQAEKTRENHEKTIEELQKNAASASLSAENSSAQSKEQILNLEKLIDNYKTQLDQIARENAAEKLRLQKELEDTKNQLHSTQLLQIETMKAKVLAEQALKKATHVKRSRNFAALARVRRQAKKISSFF